ncbi:non-specific lipid transfer protein GPI-anchored 26-like [Silene latifolia]|uniref:non-specific lipid transfer protein GPI-anchored 26-like n=1 Tax=Silene latifolia TaxID=37657 RepID=UPI003D788487
MSSKVSQLCLIFLILVISLKCNEVRAQSSTTGCTSVLVSMSSCLTYITGSSSTPAASCCSTLANVVKSQPQCLCAALSSGAASSLGVSINQTRALELPASCNVQTPPVSKCNGPTSTSGAAAAPADSPAGVPGETSDGPSAEFPSGSGSKTVPGTAGSASDGSTVKSSLGVLAFIVSCSSILAIF